MSERLRFGVAPSVARAYRLALAAVAATILAASGAHAQRQAQGAAAQARAAEFTSSERTDAEWAKRLGIPVYFAVPNHARAELPRSLNTTDRLIDFKHPDAKGADVGLRLVVAKRAGMGRRLAQAGLLQTGDVILTFRPEWGGAGAYPNIQMGISHAGIVYVKDGVAYQLDNPMDAEYLGANFRGDFTSSHYRTLQYLHVVRPRSLTQAQREAIVGWASRLNANARKVYPSQIAFNQDYNAPKYKSGQPLDFVHRVGQAALGLPTAGKLDLFCSEFVWAVLALRDCDPTGNADDFKGSRVPSCVKPIMNPLRVAGSYPARRGGASSDAGLADGPLIVVENLKLTSTEQESLLGQIFVENPAKSSRMSAGHRKLAQDLSPKYAPLQQYYKDAAAGGLRRMSAWYVANEFRRAVPENYSPTSFLVNSLLPAGNNTRAMDYVATLVLE